MSFLTSTLSEETVQLTHYVDLGGVVYASYEHRRTLTLHFSELLNAYAADTVSALHAPHHRSAAESDYVVGDASGYALAPASAESFLDYYRRVDANPGFYGNVAVEGGAVPAIGSPQALFQLSGTHYIDGVVCAPGGYDEPSNTSHNFVLEVVSDCPLPTGGSNIYTSYDLCFELDTATRAALAGWFHREPTHILPFINDFGSSTATFKFTSEVPPKGWTPRADVAKLDQALSGGVGIIAYDSLLSYDAMPGEVTGGAFQGQYLGHVSIGSTPPYTAELYRKVSGVDQDGFTRAWLGLGYSYGYGGWGWGNAAAHIYTPFEDAPLTVYPVGLMWYTWLSDLSASCRFTISFYDKTGALLGSVTEDHVMDVLDTLYPIEVWLPDPDNPPDYNPTEPSELTAYAVGFDGNTPLTLDTSAAPANTRFVSVSVGGVTLPSVYPIINYEMLDEEPWYQITIVYVPVSLYGYMKMRNVSAMNRPWRQCPSSEGLPLLGSLA